MIEVAKSFAAAATILNRETKLPSEKKFKKVNITKIYVMV